MLIKAIAVTALAAGAAVVSVPAPAQAGNLIPFTLTSPPVPGLYVQCIGPFFRRSGCIALGPSANDRSKFYTAEDGLFGAFGRWGCNIHKAPDCVVGLAPLDFCIGENKPAQVDLTFDGGTALTVNANRSCRSTAASSMLGQGGEDDFTLAQDVDTYDFPGRSNEQVAVVLDHGSGGGTNGEVSLRVVDEAGGTLAQKTGKLPLKVQATLRGPMAVQVRRAGAGADFRGSYSVTPEAGDVGGRQLRPRQNVEQ